MVINSKLFFWYSLWTFLTLCLLLWSDRSHLLSVRRAPQPAPVSQINPLLSLKANTFRKREFVTMNEAVFLSRKVHQRSDIKSWKRSCCLIGITLSPTRRAVIPIHPHSPPPPLRYLPHIQDGTDEFPSAAASAAVGQWRSALCCVNTRLTGAFNEMFYIKWIAT